MTIAFGPMLRQWRDIRKLSQLELGLAADVSARHISFLETGRAHPSRAMVLRLSDHLEVPRGTRNTMLDAAGFAPAYRARSLEESEMAPVRAALDWLLERHAPYPAFVLDRHWTVMRANAPSAMLFGAAGLGEGSRLLDVFGDIERLRAMLENWEEAARHLARRLRTESAHLGGDSYLLERATALEGAVGPDDPSHRVEQAVIPAIYRAGDMRLSLFSTISQFGAVDDIALADWKIEHMFPADEQTRAILQSLGGQA